MEPLSADEQSLIKIDAIFKALGIKNVDDIQTLTKYMVVEDTPGREKLIEADEVIKNLKRYTDDRKLHSLQQGTLLKSSGMKHVFALPESII